MLSLAEAEALIDRHLGSHPRAAHSRDVGRIMVRLARRFDAEETLWQLTGLCHDLDYFAVEGDWSRHGILTGEWLAGQLPEAALRAIAAHDHRAGRADESLIGDMLRLADALSIAANHLGREVIVAASPDLWRERLGKRAYLADIVEVIARRRQFQPGDLGMLLGFS